MKKFLLFIIFILPLIAQESNVHPTNVSLIPDFSFDFDTIAYPEGFKSMTLQLPCVIIGEYRYGFMLLDAQFGQQARKTLLPYYRNALTAAFNKIDVLILIRDSLTKSMVDLQDKYRKRGALIFIGSIGGVVIGVCITIGFYYLIRSTI